VDSKKSDSLPEPPTKRYAQKLPPNYELVFNLEFRISTDPVAANSDLENENAMKAMALTSPEPKALPSPPGFFLFRFDRHRLLLITICIK
jgi:hypothetical protein